MMSVTTVLTAIYIYECFPSLRHTYASLMIADGTPLVVVSHKLGHAQTSTTANIYAHVIASAEERATRTDAVKSYAQIRLQTLAE